MRKTLLPMWCAVPATLGLFLLIMGPACQAGQAETDTMEITALKESLGRYLRPVEPGDDIRDVLLHSPFRLVRRGTGAVSDLYNDGLKRGDINVTVDGERFTTACPNRMDTRIGQLDLGDMGSVDIWRNSAVLQSGLGGQVDFRRRPPGEDRRIFGALNGGLDSTEELDASLAVEGRRLRLGGRYRSIQPYSDADGNTFSELYGYVENAGTEIFEIKGLAAYGQGHAVLTYEGSTDVLFPYLLMDERNNDHYQASASYLGHRVYFNHTQHLMDNALRSSYATTDMVTDATNTMFGVVGGFYEFYARNWNADNRITPVANPAMQKLNHMLPDVWRYGFSVQYEVGDAERPWLFLRAGAAHTRVGDQAAGDLYRKLEPDAELERWSLPLGLTATHMVDLSDGLLLGFSGEISSDSPGMEQLYIATDKPGTKPDWVGNPRLSDPVRATARAALQKGRFQVEIFGTRIWKYPYLTRRNVEGAMYQTYTGVDALLAGANLFGSWRWFDAGMSWNWGQKCPDRSPLAEIQPLSLYLQATSPVLADHFTVEALYQHNAGQGRVDQALDETSTGAWNRVDLGLNMKRGGFLLRLGLENLTNVLYSQHLSYLRSPFSSGLRINEPGRVVRLTAAFKY
jgi:iron complex outermembrane receptor protein